MMDMNKMEKLKRIEKDHKRKSEQLRKANEKLKKRFSKEKMIQILDSKMKALEYQTSDPYADYSDSTFNKMEGKIELLEEMIKMLK